MVAFEVEVVRKGSGKPSEVFKAQSLASLVHNSYQAGINVAIQTEEECETSDQFLDLIQVELNVGVRIKGFNDGGTIDGWKSSHPAGIGIFDPTVCSIAMCNGHYLEYKPGDGIHSFYSIVDKNLCQTNIDDLPEEYQGCFRRLVQERELIQKWCNESKVEK